VADRGGLGDRQASGHGHGDDGDQRTPAHRGMMTRAAPLGRRQGAPW
jgi:hypothetical protein